MHRRVAAAAGLALLAGLATAPAGNAAPRGLPRHVVVVATLDTGANPFHPTWRRSITAHPSTYVPGYPRTAKAVTLKRTGKDFDDDVDASGSALDRFGGSLTYVPGTNIIGAIAHKTDAKPVFDQGGSSHSHGAAASSQIAGTGLGFSPGALLVVVDRTPDSSTVHPYEANAELLRWAADQPWIDVIHTNIQNIVPMAQPELEVAGFAGYPEAVEYAVSKGKVVVSAGGNWFVEPTETSPHAGPPGVLVAGANDNCGYTDFSNPDPHVVSDGMGTPAAAARSYENVAFSGTSSASPRISGYVAELILRLRRVYDHRGGIKGGALVTVPAGKRPSTGPLADGRLTAAEAHEIVRKTADPMSHASKFDGTVGLECIPQVVAGPYAKMGYGEVSEHTLGDALAVARGQAPMPARLDADPFYDASEALRRQLWP